MEEPIRGRSRHVELRIDQLVELQPGLGRLMPEVSRRLFAVILREAKNLLTPDLRPASARGVSRQRQLPRLPMEGRRGLRVRIGANLRFSE